MHIHEYQAKQILQSYQISIPPFRIVKNVQEAAEALAILGLDQAVVKVQVHAGGRGKAGGVKIGKSKEEILALVDQMIGMKIVNEQTGTKGVIAHEVMLTSLVEIEKEYYLACVIDREKARGVLIASLEGGMEIEKIAATTPEKILTLPLDLHHGLRGYDGIRLAKFLKWDKERAQEGIKVAKNLARAFFDTDSELLEINPFVLTKDHQFMALDAKLSLDDNARFRQQKIDQFYDPSQDSESERTAKEHDLAYIALEGNIGCMVNGAGLAMATMDIIHYYGGQPANFLDVGGSATKEKVAQGFKIILSDPQVKVILVNIFGGIMNCETIAEGIIYAVNEIHLNCPLIVRLEGTNAIMGKKRLKESGLKIIPAEDLKDAAIRSIQALKE